jgi:hypothetical protein
MRNSVLGARVMAILAAQVTCAEIGGAEEEAHGSRNDSQQRGSGLEALERALIPVMRSREFA